MKAKLLKLITDSGYDNRTGDDYCRVYAEGITDWEEISDEDYNHLKNYVEKNFGYILISETAHGTIKQCLKQYAKDFAAAEQAKEERLKKKEERDKKRLERFEAKRIAQEKKLLKELEAKYKS